MDARPKTRQVDRERKTPSTQVPRGAKQIVIPMTQQQYDDIWHDADRVRRFIEQCARSAPELFPAGFDQGYCLHGFGRESEPASTAGRVRMMRDTRLASSAETAMATAR